MNWNITNVRARRGGARRFLWMKGGLLCSLAFIGLLSQARGQMTSAAPPPALTPISKGTVMLGGDVGFSHQSSSQSDPGSIGTTTSQVNFLPSYAKAIKDNLLLGFDLSFGYSSMGGSAIQNTQKNYEYGAGIFFM